jgi:hypothetical protein
VIGNYLYALGGIGTGSLNSVERATINISGSLGPLAISSSTTLTTARGGQATVVVGNYLYVLGGYANGGLNSVERASIDADGSLGQLATVSGVTLAAARYNHTAAVVGNSVYVLGGLANSVTLNSVERAIIAADGSLGAFAPVAGITMRSARNSHTAAVVGNYLYVLGGSNGNVVLDNVERAPIAPDGSLGPFESAPNGPLMTARVYHTTAVIGNYLYVIGGFGNNGLSNIERASIAADGSLGPFAPVSGVALTTARYDHVTAVVGNYLYVLGGGGDVTPLSSVERATLGADGSLGSFAPVASLTLATARVQHTAVIVRNYLYVLGGSDLKGYLNSVERVTLSAEGPH